MPEINTKDIDIVIPLYNEGETLERNILMFVNFLKESKFPYSYSVTLVDNASTDNSLEVCKKLKKAFSQINFLHLETKGKGGAIHYAWSLSTAKVLAFMDADMSSGLLAFRPLVESVLVAKNDVAIGNRLGNNSKVVCRKFVRKIASRLYNLFVRLLFDTKIRDHQCGFKALRREAFLALSPFLLDKNFFMDTEMLVFARQMNFRVEEIDVVWVDRKESKVNILQTSLQFLQSCWKLKNRIR